MFLVFILEYQIQCTLLGVQPQRVVWKEDYHFCFLITRYPHYIKVADPACPANDK